MSSIITRLDDAIKHLFVLNAGYVAVIGKPVVRLEYRHITNIVNVGELNSKLDEIDNLYRQWSESVTATASENEEAEGWGTDRKEFVKSLQKDVLTHVETCIGLITLKNSTYKSYLDNFPWIDEDAKSVYMDIAPINTDAFIDELTKFHQSIESALFTSNYGGDSDKPLSSLIAHSIHICLRTVYAVSLQCISFNKYINRKYLENDDGEIEMDKRVEEFGRSLKKTGNTDITRISLEF
ncbi:hypothetical protein H4219_003846 [Mycoemilia scoparia]|uniref:Uncharacterized protein n=1 Tax=Mycoemilia scoparia TaxID=417184 RepID=A0A9W8A1L1_9FUNG|nr:hypothetical protein H4219_003846 [Mycoemilia scoparia]